MTRRSRRVGLAFAMSMIVAACGEPTAAPAPAPRALPADPRLPPGFDVPLPAGAIVRYGETRAGRARATLTMEGTADAARDAIEAGFVARGWSARREGAALVALDAGRERARAELEVGASGLTRVVLEEARAGRHAGELEPRAWRQIARAPLPPPSGGGAPACTALVREACAAWAERAAADALDCALDHRAPCFATELPAYHARALEDAGARLSLALRAHDQVASEAARAETQAQLRVERLCARIVAARALAAGLEIPASLEAPLAASAPREPSREPDVAALWPRNTSTGSTVEDAVTPTEEQN